MSRLYRRPYKAKLNDDAWFVWLVLLYGTVWAHKVALQQIEQVSSKIGLMVAFLVCLVLVAQFLLRLSPKRRATARSIKQIDIMFGLEFEKYVAGVLKQQGYKNVALTEYYDLGVDILAEKAGIKWGIQVKRYSGLVGVDAIRQVITGLRFYSCDRAMVVTNSEFSHSAEILADSNECMLINRSALGYVRTQAVWLVERRGCKRSASACLLMHCRGLSGWSCFIALELG